MTDPIGTGRWPQFKMETRKYSTHSRMIALMQLLLEEILALLLVARSYTAWDRRRR